MQREDVDERARQAVRSLRRSYSAYMTSLKNVVEQGDRAIPALLDALDHKQANPIAQALGLLMPSPMAGEAIPRLLDWVVVQAPIHPDARDALLRAGDRVTSPLIARLRQAAEVGDDEAVRNLLDLGVRLSDESLERLVPVVVELLEHRDPHIREAAADAIWRLGLPYGRPAVAALRRLRDDDDEEDEVRTAAAGALLRLGLDR